MQKSSLWLSYRKFKPGLQPLWFQVRWKMIKAHPKRSLSVLNYPKVLSFQILQCKLTLYWFLNSSRKIYINNRFLNDKLIVANVKEKEEAKKVYNLAKERGESAGHVVQAWDVSHYAYYIMDDDLPIIFSRYRQTNSFKIEANVAAKSSVVFNLTYQELLKRVSGVYKHVINISPDQVFS